jgi:hypothetical protein
MSHVLRMVLTAITGASTIVLTGAALNAAPVMAATGADWSQVPTPSSQAPQAELAAVSCPSQTACTAVGDYYNANGAQVTLAEAWHGGSWAIQPTPDPAGAGISVLLGVSCASPDACMAVGYTRYVGGHPEQPLAEAWNGKSWKIAAAATPGKKPTQLSAVSCTAPASCMAVGFTSNGIGPLPLTETWDGTAWTLQQAPLPAGSNHGQLSGVSCTTATACTAVGQWEAGTTTGTLAEAWNGSAWAVQSTPDPAGQGGQSVLSAISCLPGGTACTAAGYWLSNGEDVTLAEARTGTTWKVVPTPTPTGTQGIVQGLFTGISCSSANACGAVGDHINDAGHQVSLMEAWDGTAWKIVPAPAGEIAAAVSGVSCPLASRCTAAGVGYPTSQGAQPGQGDAFTLAEAWNGTAWTTQQTPNPTGLIFTSLSAVACAARTSCAVAGYRSWNGAPQAFSETWDGTRWAIRPVPVPASADTSQLTAVACPSPGYCVAVGDYQSATTGGERTVSETWNGSRWTVKSMPVPQNASTTQLSGITCLSATSCVAVGWDDGGTGGVGLTLVETWNGTAWKIQPSPNPPTAAGGSSLSAVSCASAGSCSAVGTYLTGESPYLSFAEYWNGSRWTVQSTPNAAGTDTYLDGVSCPAPGTCTAVGYTAANQTLVENLKTGTWTVTAGPSPGKGGSLAGIWCAATTACSAVGQYTTSGGNGRALAEHWNGQAWSVQPAPVSSAGAYQVNELTGVSCVAASWCMASGSNQTYYVPATGALSAVTERYAPGTTKSGG